MSDEEMRHSDAEKGSGDTLRQGELDRARADEPAGSGGASGEARNVSPSSGGASASTERDAGKRPDGVVALARLVYTHNPFYLVSACLVLWGLSLLFSTRDETVYAWTLLGTLAGYSALLAIMAVVIVRLGKVWDDARTIIVALLIIIVALSGSFDQLVIESPWTGVPVLLAGLVFAVVLSEAMMRGCGIRMPALFRGPYHAVVALLFGYPLVLFALLSLMWQGSRATRDVPVSWGLYLFPFAAAAVFLSLVPAIRRGAEYLRNNGTPWKWPHFPWTLFALLGLAACVRTWWLTISFYPARGMESPFALYFLAPFVLAAAVLLLEAGIASREGRLVGAALALPLVAVAMCLPGMSLGPLQRRFMRTITDGLAAPALFSTGGAAGFYLYAWGRGAALAEVGLVLSLLVSSVIGARTTGVARLVPPQAFPLVALAAVQLWRAFRERASWRAVAIVVVAVAAASAALRGTWFNTASGAFPVHLVVAGVLVVGLAFDDRYARTIQHVGAASLAALFAGALLRGGGIAPGVSGWEVAGYHAALACLTVWLWVRTGNASFFYALVAEAAALALYLGGMLFSALGRSDRPRGAWALFWGAVSLLVAGMISLVKCGMVSRALASLRAARAERNGT